MIMISATTNGPFVRLDTSCKDYTVMTASGFATSRRAVAVNPTTCQIATLAVTTWTLVNPSTRKAGVNVQKVTTWRVSTRGHATSCTASKSSSVAVCTTDVKWPTGGECLTRKVGYNARRLISTSLGCGGTTIKVKTIRFLYWRRQSAVQLLHQIRTHQQPVKMPIGGASWISKYLHFKS